MNHAKPSVLVVDDEPDTCSNLSDILTQFGYEVATACNGASALELMRRRRYDVALLDLMMPDMDGLTLYRAMKRERAGTVALIVTGYPGSIHTGEALAAGIWQVLPKPVEVPALLELVKKAVGQPLVLVVDDDPDLCANLWDLLRQQGYRVCLAHDERTAAERLAEGRFDIVLLDLRLPDAHGASVFRRAREIDPQARVVVITGHQAEEEPQIQQMLAEGAVGVFQKPFDIPKLMSVLHELGDAR